MIEINKSNETTSMVRISTCRRQLIQESCPDSFELGTTVLNKYPARGQGRNCTEALEITSPTLSLLSHATVLSLEKSEQSASSMWINFLHAAHRVKSLLISSFAGKSVSFSQDGTTTYGTKTISSPSIAPFNASILGSMVSNVIWNSSFCSMASRRRLYLLAIK